MPAVREVLLEVLETAPFEDGWVPLTYLGQEVRVMGVDFRAEGKAKFLELVRDFSDVIEVRREGSSFPPIYSARSQRPHEERYQAREAVKIDDLSTFLIEVIEDQPNPGEWMSLSAFGARTKTKGLNPEAFEYERLLDLLRDFPEAIELKADNEFFPPVYSLRSKRQPLPVMPAAPSTEGQAATSVRPMLQPKGHESSRAFAEWAYTPHPQAVEKLRSHALKEPWAFSGDDPRVSAGNPLPILSSYLKFTFYRLQREGKICETLHPELGRIAAFNTGLVNTYFDPIFGLYVANPEQGNGRPAWKFADFCVPAQDRYGKLLVSTFSQLPEAAHYFESPQDLIFDMKAGKPWVDWEHVILENVDRIPVDLLAECLPNTFAVRPVDELDDAEKENYLTEVRKIIQEHGAVARKLRERFDTALTLAVKRVHWNFRTCVPSYYPRANKVQLMLPLALVREDRVDGALVLERNPSGNYTGHTMLTLWQAYNNARLLCRPGSDWLKPELTAFAW